MTTPSIGASSSPSLLRPDGIGVPRSSGRISPRSVPASGGVGAGGLLVRRRRSSGERSVDGWNSSEKREPRCRHQRSNAAS